MDVKRTTFTRCLKEAPYKEKNKQPKIRERKFDHIIIEKITSNNQIWSYADIGILLNTYYPSSTKHKKIPYINLY
jgi:hypothetical protein